MSCIELTVLTQRKLNTIHYYWMRKTSPTAKKTTTMAKTWAK